MALVCRALCCVVLCEGGKEEDFSSGPPSHTHGVVEVDAGAIYARRIFSISRPFGPLVHSFVHASLALSHNSDDDDDDDDGDAASIHTIAGGVGRGWGRHGGLRAK